MTEILRTSASDKGAFASHSSSEMTTGFSCGDGESGKPARFTGTFKLGAADI